MHISKFISVDFQKEFTTPNGKWYNPGESVNFIKNILIPYFEKHNIKINEIISDYRQPRPGDSGDGCYPGDENYESEIPSYVKNNDVRIKCMNSPIWVRENIGVSDKEPGLPYQDPESFSQRLNKNIGTLQEIDEIVLIGLTIDRYIFATAQELKRRGYNVKILKEATDAVRGDKKYKEALIKQSPLLNWAEIISREDHKREKD